MKLLTKKSVLPFWVLAVLSVILIQYYKVSVICTFNNNFDRDCSHILATFRDLALYASVLLVPVIFTIPFKPVVFEAWKRFAIWTAPITAFCAVWAMNILAGGLGYMAGGGLLVGIILLGLYYLASLVVIAATWYKLHSKQQISITKQAWLGGGVMLVGSVLLVLYMYFLA